MTSWEPDETDFEDQYDKADPIDDDNLDESINELNRSIREQEELESRIRRTEWSSMDKNEQMKLEGQIAFNEEKWSLRILGKKFMKDMGFDVDKPKSGTKSKIPKKRMEQKEQYVDEIDENTKQFASELNEFTSK